MNGAGLTGKKNKTTKIRFVVEINILHRVDIDILRYFFLEVFFAFFAGAFFVAMEYHPLSTRE
jgi:hypothetical protein